MMLPRMMKGCLGDLRISVRRLMKAPLFTSFVTLCLALGVGTTVVVFSVVDGLLLRPLPFLEPDTLVSLWRIWDDEQSRELKYNIHGTDFQHLAEELRTVDSLSAARFDDFNITSAGEPERIVGARVSASLFPLLGIEPVVGRVFTPEEERRYEMVAVVASGFWERRWGRDPDVLGRKIEIGGVPHLVVGVLPSGKAYPSRAEIWVPFRREDREDRTGFDVVGRLGAGVSLAAARLELSAQAERLREIYPARNAMAGLGVEPLHDRIAADRRPVLLSLLTAVGFLLLLACANVAHLLLVRVGRRAREMSVRAALGAGQLRILRQLMTENLVLGGLGGFAGLVLAWFLLPLVLWLSPSDFPSFQAISLDARALAVAAGMSLVAVLVFGLLPAFHALRTDLVAGLRDGRSSSGRRGRRLQHVLVVVDVAITLVLLSGAGLLIRSFARLEAEDLGFETKHLLTLRVNAPPSFATEHYRRIAFFRDVRAALSGVPGVEAVGAANPLPLSGSGFWLSFTVEDRPPETPGETEVAFFQFVTPGYLESLGMPLLRGRIITESDAAEAAPVTVVNRSFAERYWTLDGAVGRRIRRGRLDDANEWITVAGVVEDVSSYEIGSEPLPALYIPMSQLARDYNASMSLVLRTSSAPAALVSQVREHLRSIDARTVLYDIRTMDQVVSVALGEPRFQMQLLLVFAALALILATAGIYGLLASSVSERTPELALRMALGARGTGIVRTVVRDALRMTSLGLLLGWLAAFGLTRFLSDQLYRTEPHDLTTFMVVALILLGAAAAASWLPARQASRLDPVTALRQE